MERIILNDIEIQHTDAFDCQCSVCQGDPETREGSTDLVGPYVIPSDSLSASVDPLAGTVAPNGKPIWSVEQIAAHLNRTGASWIDGPDPAPQRGDDDPTTITFGFFESQAELVDNGYVYFIGDDGYGFSEYFNFASFTDAQRAAAREAVQSWDDVAAISFVETDADNADINFGNLASAPQTQAYARLPFANLTSDPDINAQIQPIAGDVWISASQASNFQLDEGRYGLQTLTHEVGHSLGLSHPGAYNAAPGVSITYPNNAEYYQDTRAYTVMSYFNANFSGGQHFDFHLSTTAYSGVPLVHDIAAIQAMYGADMTTRTGDTTYGFNSNAGRDSYDFDATPAPIMAIWDAAGEDTIDASGYDTNQIIDLREGALSSIGGVTIDSAPTFEETNANRAAAGLPPIARATYDGNIAFLAANPGIGALTDNVGIAYGAIIENAIGGSGDDLLVGNDAENTLTGNGGSDGLFGGAGADVFVLDGDFAGDGSDLIADFTSDDTIRLTNVAGARVVFEQVGEDTVISFDGIEIATVAGTDAAAALAGADFRNSPSSTTLIIDGEEMPLAISGTSGDDTIRGIAGVENVIAGNAGDDRILGRGKSDVLLGNAGNDVLDGANGSDTLFGGRGDDELIGGNGGDTLNGDRGNDLLRGGNGNDILTGGSGSDVFFFENDNFRAGVDRVTDFNVDEDSIEFSGNPNSVTFSNSAAGAEMFVDGNLMAIFEGVTAEEMLGGPPPAAAFEAASEASQLSAAHSFYAGNTMPLELLSDVVMY
ncbi:matrixin family metalloprotease [Erythrobacter litoralis]|uniref:M10 family metallopeptidase C-terminal domain-containing protein n=1 Tax=Erythrobacter litoralis TaxID=39960 RepID=UPI002435318D|nr:M10 family metallopeptidase C-terminal domain-containing protein [Erythrobacter litoralis]MDG6078745.1 matrixin family metalloprotease [Erythrobacter litoralis]